MIGTPTSWRNPGDDPAIVIRPALVHQFHGAGYVLVDAVVANGYLLAIAVDNITRHARVRPVVLTDHTHGGMLVTEQVGN